MDVYAGRHSEFMDKLVFHFKLAADMVGSVCVYHLLINNKEVSGYILHADCFYS